MVPPLVLDIDGTLTRADATDTPEPIDSRVLDPIRTWDAPVVIATGKSFPYPVALAQFIGVEPIVIAENGGIAVARGNLRRFVSPTVLEDILTALREEDILPPADGFDDINEWRETELALPRSLDIQNVRKVANRYGMEVIDSKFAFHVKDPSVSKGVALEWIADEVNISLEDAVAIGDSVNDVSNFERVGRGIALANADEAAKGAADEILTMGYADGTLSVLRELLTTTET